MSQILTTIIVGAMKSGTTSLFYYLSEHPEICASKEKELHFFSDETRFSRGIDWYRSMWQIEPQHRIALEASPTYTMQPYRPNVAERISDIDTENFKFLYIARNPIGRFESHVRHEVAQHQLTGSAVTKLKESDEPIAYTQYARQLEGYIERFGRERVHVLLLEDLTQSPQAELQKVCRFLGIDETYHFKNVDVVRNSKDTLNLNPFIGKIRHLPLIKPLVELISPRTRQSLRVLLTRKDPFEFHLTSQEKEKILQTLKPDLQKFEQLYQLNIADKWGISLD